MATTTLALENKKFLINGQPTYQGASFRGQSLEGLMFNSRMIQAIFDDHNPETRAKWAYPDTGVWDAERNTAEFCAMLPVYRAHGLLAVTVGLQGGGSVYTKEIFPNVDNTAFNADGTLRPDYFARLEKVIGAADAAGMVVIVNYFYFGQEKRFTDEAAMFAGATNATEWLLAKGYKNVMLDVKNEIQIGDGLLATGGVHRMINHIRDVSGPGLLIGTSTFPMPDINHLPEGKFYDVVDFLMPHGNNSEPDAWRRELEIFLADPRVAGKPVLCNEDSTYVANLDVSAELGVSWGYYDQGYGCGMRHGKQDWQLKDREARFEDLSGYQTLPINWGINTDDKRAFFARVKELSEGLAR
ncbi:MAG: hypothetical protein ACO1O4_11855 [Devosia sp.]